jgi:hypothetical protein
MDYSLEKTQLWRRIAGQTREWCPVSTVRAHGGIPTSDREDTMREALSLDPHFPTMALRDEAAGPGQWYAPEFRGVDAEIYNPFYYQRNSGLPGSCPHVPAPRSCFQPVYGLGCLDTLEPTYNQPVAFWTSAFANRIADVPGAVGARSIVFGFPPVFFEEADFQPVMNHILFDEWQLPRSENLSSGGR